MRDSRTRITSFLDDADRLGITRLRRHALQLPFRRFWPRYSAQKARPSRPQGPRDCMRCALRPRPDPDRARRALPRTRFTRGRQGHADARTELGARERLFLLSESAPWLAENHAEFAACHEKPGQAGPLDRRGPPAPSAKRGRAGAGGRVEFISEWPGSRGGRSRRRCGREQGPGEGLRQRLPSGLARHPTPS